MMLKVWQPIWQYFFALCDKFKPLKPYNYIKYKILLAIAEKNKRPKEIDIKTGCQLKTFLSQSRPPKHY